MDLYRVALSFLFVHLWIPICWSSKQIWPSHKKFISLRDSCTQWSSWTGVSIAAMLQEIFKLPRQHEVLRLYLEGPEEFYCELNYDDQKIWRTLVCDIWKHWTAVLTLLGGRKKRMKTGTVCVGWKEKWFLGNFISFTLVWLQTMLSCKGHLLENTGGGTMIVCINKEIHIYIYIYIYTCVCDNEQEPNEDSSRKRARLCLACRTEK